MVQADRGAGQVVEQRLHALMEQRHPMLHAGMAPPIRDRQVNRVRGRRLAEQFAPAGSKTADRIRVERHFRHRPEGQPLPAIGTALRRWVEDADQLDRVAEQVEANRLGLAGRENVDNAAAHGVFAGFHHRAGTPIAGGLQEAGQLLRLHRAASAQLQAGAGERGTRRHALHQGIHCGQHDARPGGHLQQARQRGDALGDQRRIGRHTVIRQAVPGREPQHFRLRRDERQRLRQPCHARIVAGDVQHRAGEFAAATGEQESVPTLGGAEYRGGCHGAHIPPAPLVGGGWGEGLPAMRPPAIATRWPGLC